MENAFIRGFIKKANQSGVSSEDALHWLKTLTGISDTKDSLFGVADNVANKSTADEVGSIGKHLASHGAVPGLLGAGVGGLAGLASSKDKAQKLKRTLIGALIGGGSGFLAGALNDAYHLGDNTRDELVDNHKESREEILAGRAKNNQKLFGKKPDEVFQNAEDKVNHNISALEDSKWFEYYYPPKVIEKLK